ncbi:Shr3 amino acid permease chaperone [Phaffia rhodozyma]|uniref:Shr3 amino acid permease chaperone n=1 Tax=Phaffia rhodozyma TaxID=264483 RepID=A0A0F7SS38_PHARH|nr:Shr3 amino acid permease chaperone [Phaffia rhodozyma]
MPAFLSSVVYTCSAFLLGVVLVNQIVDYDLLYSQLTEASIEKAYVYYQTWWDAPVGVKALLHVLAVSPVLALILKLNAWTESAIFFDGSALVLQVATLILYLTVHIPSLRTFLPPSPPAPAGTWSFLPPAVVPEVPPSAGDRADAVRVLAAGNALVAICLIGTIGMQAGQEYARKTEEREQRLMDEKAQREAERVKKDL